MAVAPFDQTFVLWDGINESVDVVRHANFRRNAEMEKSRMPLLGTYAQSIVTFQPEEPW